MAAKRIAIVGTVGVPANYGGFETLAENLVKFHAATGLESAITVYCSERAYPSKAPSYLSAELRYIPLDANGKHSIFYDIWAMLSAILHRTDVVLLLGVSGAIALPLIRLISCVRVVTNIDGIEWRRKKWRGLAKYFLRFSEALAVRYSHDVVTDNEAIAEYVTQRYGVMSHVIAYGGDQAVDVDASAVEGCVLPDSYACAVCRIEPENNVEMILAAFARVESRPIVVVGNWNNSEYGRSLRARFASKANLILLDPIYDLGKLKALRSRSACYVHGHSAGGTNPSLVEAMHFGLAVLAYDCNFNRHTTEGKAVYFSSSEALVERLLKSDIARDEYIGRQMLEIAQRRYRWRDISQRYFALLDRTG